MSRTMQVPVQYKELTDSFTITERIESNINRMYFDTGILSDADVDFEMRIAFAGSTAVSNEAIIDGGSPYDNWAVIIWNGALSASINGVSVDLGTAPSNEPLTVALIGNSVYYNGVLEITGTRSSVHNPVEIRLLSYERSDGGRTYIPIHFYYTKIWKNGTLIRHYVYHEDAQGVSCLYDLVTETILYGTSY